MGLDMYLDRKVYVGMDWDGKKEDKKVKITKTSGEVIEFGTKKLKELVFEAGYWRKANHIHKWFVENVQDGEDNCNEYDVSIDQLKELLSLVNKVIKGSVLVKGKISNGWTYKNGKKEPIMEDGKYIKNSKIAELLLPCEEGFFFGATEYDQYYYDSLVETKKILEEAIKDGGYFVYRSSW